MKSTMFALILLIASGAAFAEGGCPSGQYPYDTPQARQCVPMSGGNGGGAQGYWADSYAAVTWGRDKNGAPAYSWATGGSDQAEADAAALESCKNAGYHECRIGHQFANGYFAVVKSQDGSLYAASSFGWLGARMQAAKECKRAGGIKCKVVESQRSRSTWVE